MSTISQCHNFLRYFFKFCYIFQIRGDSIGFYKLLYRLVAQKPLEFFQNHSPWSKSPDENTEIEDGNFGSRRSKSLTKSIKKVDEGMN